VNNFQYIDAYVANTASPADFNLHQEIYYRYPSPAKSITAMEAVVNQVSERSERPSKNAQVRLVSKSTSRAPFVVELTA